MEKGNIIKRDYFVEGTGQQLGNEQQCILYIRGD
jgi:hypothetical protein